MTNEDAIKILEEMPISSNVHFEEIAEAIGIAIKALRNERPKGEWKEWINEKWGGISIYCPNCREPAFEKSIDGVYRQVKSNYCPNCGADMRGDKE